MNGFEEDEALLKGWIVASFGLEVEVDRLGSDLGAVARLTKEEDDAELDRV